MRITLPNKKAIANIDKICVESEDQHELLGIAINSNQTFENDINKLCKKTSQKLNTLARISNYMEQQKTGVKIDALHERTLRNTYKDKITLFN